MEGIAEFGVLNCVYLFLFVLGVGYAIVAWIMGGLSHLDLPGIDIDIPGIDLHPGGPDIHLELPFGHDVSHDLQRSEVGLSPLSPIIIATFITVTGGMGLISDNLLYLSPVWGLFFSLVCGVIAAGGVFLVYTRVLVAAQGSSEAHIGEMVGQMGEVTAPIPADKVGEVAFIVRGARVRNPARSADGRAIPRGTMVKVQKEVGNVVIVQPIEPQVDHTDGSGNAERTRLS